MGFSAVSVGSSHACGASARPGVVMATAAMERLTAQVMVHMKGMHGGGALRPQDAGSQQVEKGEGVLAAGDHDQCVPRVREQTFSPAKRAK